MRFALKNCRFVFGASVYWVRGGINGARAPRIPRRHGYGPYETTARYVLITGFYPIALAAWLIGTACRVYRRRRPPPVQAEAVIHWDTVRHLQVFSADECSAACERIHQMQRLWVPRQPGFFTLGRAAYMDCLDLPQRHRYFEEARRLNGTLIEHFRSLYDALILALQTELNAPCQLANNCAIPGFHVWLGEGIPRFGFDAGSVHFDLQYFDVGLYKKELHADEDTISFTLPLRLPKAGGGLNIWDVRHPETVGWGVWPFKRVSQVQYSIGYLVLHTGHELHQIVPIDRVQEGDQRICLQGHGYRQNGVWLLYW